MFQKLTNYNIENKELDNIILIICHLYTFQIFHHSLIYEILNKLSAELTEKSVECILLILRSIGFVLRKDNPLGLKEFILKIQKSAASAPDELKNE
jgi:nucleolar MIF4G domain-containing protein 1